MPLDKWSSAREDPLDQLLDEEADNEFGAPVIRDSLHHNADPNRRGDLGSWEASDFSSAYVRFFPHLVRHAKRYASDSHRAEEIVQESFLYLMTALPSIDNEEGVLRFLKWKIKMLCLDDIRRKAEKAVSPDDQQLDSGHSEKGYLEIERAEDEAIVNLALAKLQPRQREILIASIYEEKRTDEISKQLEISENATRQLLHRSKRAFRKKLIEEAGAAGLSVSQLLGGFVSKSSSVIREKPVKAASTLSLIVLVGIFGGSLIEPGSSVGPNVAMPEQVTLSSENTGSASAPTAVTPDLRLQENSSQTDSVGSGDEALNVSANVTDATPQSEVEPELINQPIRSSTDPLNSPLDNSARGISNDSFQTALSTDVISAGIYSESYAQNFSSSFSGLSIEVFGGTGLSAFLDYDPGTKSVSQQVVQLWEDGSLFYALPDAFAVEVQPHDNGEVIQISSSHFYLVDSAGKVFEDNPLRESVLFVELFVDSQGSPKSASMRVN